MVAREAVAPVPVTGRRLRRHEKHNPKTLGRAFWVGGVAVALLLGYTVPFAGAAREGYVQNRLRIQLQSMQRDNEFLRSEVSRLRSPGQVDAHALQEGMVQRQTAKFVTLPAPSHAKPRKSLLARLSTFRFR